MKLFVSYFFVCFSLFASAQEDTLIMTNGERVPCDVVKLSLDGAKLTIDGETTMYNHKNGMDGLITQGVRFDLRQVPNSAGMKGWRLLQILVDGEMVLCNTAVVITTKYPSGGESSQGYIYYYIGKGDEYINCGTMSWRKKLGALGSDCSGLAAKAKKAKLSAGTHSPEDLAELVSYYNTCVE